MKAVLLAGGYGTRISEETIAKPKAMVEIGGRPILWHIMKIYSAYGVNDFVVCLGYKGYVIKEYFANYFLHTSDLTFDIAKNSIEIHEKRGEPWRVTLADTGVQTMTGGRLKRVARYLNPNEDFCMTYADGVADVDVKKLIAFHRQHGRVATVTAPQPAGRFGALDITGDQVTRFQEKPTSESGRINGGFFVLSPRALEYVNDDATIWERDPLEKLAKDGQLAAYKHDGFWQPLDMLRDKIHLEELWNSGKAPWKVWHEA